MLFRKTIIFLYKYSSNFLHAINQLVFKGYNEILQVNYALVTVKPDDKQPKSSNEQLSASAVTVQPSPEIAADAVTVQSSPEIAAGAVSRQLVVVRPNDNTVQPANTGKKLLHVLLSQIRLPFK